MLSTMEFDAIIRSPATKRAEGAQCRKHNLKREDNPHEAGSINHAAWDEGWVYYDRMAKQKDADRS
ncbi:hypothetical protein UFOVP266_28 [uncultured Caudovirales phage]|uniref:Uncharacterized protein n=1 Tax=uncultured Caudovirales phage TaxID=2100421 RepID=A0A6J5LJ47_9CAUD|nr:hypothetical protein UFOVP266_28 [uncultured Caudovirales phage]